MTGLDNPSVLVPSVYYKDFRSEDPESRPYLLTSYRTPGVSFKDRGTECKFRIKDGLTRGVEDLTSSEISATPGLIL